LQSCKEVDSDQPNEYAAKFVTQLNPTDTFLVDIPRPKNKEIDSFQIEINKRNERYLALESIEKGFDSIQVRIFYACINTPRLFIILKNTGKKWKAELCRIVYPKNWQNWGDSVSRMTINGSPKSGWTKFISQLFELKVLTLPTDDNIPGFKRESVTDGCWAEVEIATKNTYRYYSYDNPDLYNYPQTKNILLILELINNEFEMKKKFNAENIWPDGNLK
jgi:hypothetical protein